MSGLRGFCLSIFIFEQSEYRQKNPLKYYTLLCGVEVNMLTRREFFRFFIIGGILSLFGKKVNPGGIAYGASDPVCKSERFLNLSSPWQTVRDSYGVKAEQKPKVAMFWRRVD